MPQPLVDPHGRTVRDLRISVTDRCNLRCTYCMPEEGMEWLPREDLLSFEELERVARVCIERFGFTGLRLTGGEPTLRAHLPVLVDKLARLGDGTHDVALTTNGTTLALLAADLVSAGLRRVTVSVDSLRPDRFAALARRDRLSQVLEGIDAAVDAGLRPVKLNVVLVRGVNDDEILELARFGRDRGATVRFIEWMPLDGGHTWGPDRVVPSAEVLATIAAAWPLEPLARGSAPAARWRYADGAGEVGVVGSVTEPFCSTCDRIRLSAEGMLRACLFAHREADLRAVLRAGGDDEAVADAIRAEVGTKWAGHAIGNVSFLQPARAMSQIGG
ncbi:MAG: Cyclic pyranopterin phosphate synthase (MoaA) [uncultured Acidimicrobiales bacterium]|uniref:GTP 3',8-cyclase n=1 Tax=uncultured Acidimicrobiales bacterium TaxID=310071 RepID=A0A6J4I358_9ACTN|nr:MAG: Cyclic pyranopterin phosphate synthase (MoaA) [uncultured Acidimicrobiales bacterium]